MTGDQNEQYKLNIVEAVLSLRKVTLTPHKFIEIQKNLEVMPARYPINRVDVRAHSVAAGLTYFVWDNCYQMIHRVECLLKTLSISKIIPCVKLRL